LPQEQFLGEWAALKVEDGKYTRLKVTRDGADWSVQGWVSITADRPLEAAVGTYRLHLLGGGVKDKALPYGLAEREETFARTYLTLRVEEDLLVVERYVVFTDGSGRSNYRTAQTFKRK
jgi:hypothetical protein